jgi:hypothetical protein
MLTQIIGKACIIGSVDCINITLDTVHRLNYIYLKYTTLWKCDPLQLLDESVRKDPKELIYFLTFNNTRIGTYKLRVLRCVGCAL